MNEQEPIAHTEHVTHPNKNVTQKFKNYILNESVRYAMFATFAILLIVGGILWIFRTRIITYIARDYIAHVTAIGDQDATISQDSFIVNTVKKTNPAVVAITISKNVPKYETYYQQYNPFQDMFGGANPFGGQTFLVPQTRQNGTEKKDIGGGSGFIVSSSGLIVTNKHVVLDKDAEYTVSLTDARKFKAKVLARDSVLDIAVLQIDATDLPYLEFGNSDTIDLGQSVIAIGNALGEFKNTVSVGVISGLSRSLTAGDGMGMSEQLEQVIQTDAAINPGNSGGPLLDIRGRVIGVNVAVAQGSQNIGFALPINAVRSVIDSVRATGKIVRPYLGIRYTGLTTDQEKKNNLNPGEGVIAKHGTNPDDDAIVVGSPAEKAGIVENDIIVAVNGVTVDTTHSLSQLIRTKKVGDTITLKIISKGVTKDVAVRLEPAPEDK